MFYFLYPWGLLALASLAAVLFLYLFVFRGKRIEVSSLHLWQAARSLRLEGRRKRRPPLTLPLLLELLSALLLSLLVAGLTFRRPATVRHLVVILDSSASMNAALGETSFRERAVREVMERFEELGRDGRVSLIESGFEPRILGRRALRREEARAALAEWRPSGPAHPMAPAVELARALSERDAVPALLTDRPAQIEGVRVVSIGQPLENSAWVASRWMGPNELFVLAAHFGDGAPRRAVSVYGDGRKITETVVDFAQRAPFPLSLTIPPEVSAVRLELPEDALANDNVLLTTRPVRSRVAVRVDLEDARLDRYVRRVVEAVPRAVLSDSARPGLRFTDSDAEVAQGAFAVRFHVPAPGSATAYVGPFVVNGFHDMTRGLDVRGVIWEADPGFRAERGLVLLSAGEVPLAVLDGTNLTLNLGPSGSNVFTTTAWPVLVANVVDYVHERSPGLKRLSYRLGEMLSFYRHPSWEGVVEVEGPDGGRVAFEGPQVYYGRLEREGLYRILCEGQPVAAFDVNLLAEGESDLTLAAPAGQDAPLEAGKLTEQAGRSFGREFALLVVAMLLGCWYLLERRSP
ncbi:MAG: hypothetical protein ACYS1C_02260 [Planctomycetota bacterium]|jgi:hypothetical protein